jgi:hypothetical protein
MFTTPPPPQNHHSHPALDRPDARGKDARRKLQTPEKMVPSDARPLRHARRFGSRLAH